MYIGLQCFPEWVASVSVPRSLQPNSHFALRSYRLFNLFANTMEQHWKKKLLTHVECNFFPSRIRWNANCPPSCACCSSCKFFTRLLFIFKLEYITGQWDTDIDKIWLRSHEYFVVAIATEVLEMKNKKWINITYSRFTGGTVRSFLPRLILARMH